MTVVRKPSWLKIKLPAGEKYSEIKQIVADNNLHTICSSGKCPNIAECWGMGTATFMILGEICTRSCKFCATITGKPKVPDKNEPLKIARSVNILKLKHCVITSVDRDDLEDGGANHWAETIKQIKLLNPNTTIETLIPDFDGKTQLLDLIISANPDIISHNIETVDRLTPLVRSKAKYKLSLKVIKHIGDSGKISKSGLMLGMGETFDEIIGTMNDLIESGCQILTLGQYLQPTLSHWPVNEYIKPEKFDELKNIGIKMGFKFVESGPLVRSSYHAEKQI